MWVVDGTYDRQGQQGQQHWEIDLNLVSLVPPRQLLGEYTYTDKAVMTVGGVTVTLDGKANGDVVLTLDSAGRGLMHFKETSHTYVATTSVGGKGQDQNAPLAEFDLAWEVDPTCP